MSTIDPHTKTAPASLGAAPNDLSTVLAREPCAGCGSPLGADQRYCLSCGIPRTGTRLPFLDVLHAEAASAGIVEHGSPPASLLRVPPLTPAPGAAGGWGGGSWAGGGGGGGRDGRRSIAARLREGTGLFALVGVLLLALLVGLLLGHWVSAGSSNLAALPSKQVVEIKYPQGALPAASPSTPTSTSTATSTPTSTSTSTETPSPAPASHASNPTVSALATSSGKEHAKAVEQALSRNGGSLTTGGAPPPRETGKPGASKAPIGGGSEVTSIE